MNRTGIMLSMLAAAGVLGCTGAEGGVACGEGTVEQDGLCLASSGTGVTCGAGTTLDADNVCQPNLGADVEIDSGNIIVSAAETITCAEGTELNTDGTACEPRLGLGVVVDGTGGLAPTCDVTAVIDMTWQLSNTNNSLECRVFEHVVLEGELNGASFGGIVPVSLPGYRQILSADLTGLALRGAYMPNAALTETNLTDVDLTAVVLSNANLSGATLIGADLTDADLGGANLAGADLTGATTTGTDFSNVSWVGATCPDGTPADSNGGHCIGRL